MKLLIISSAPFIRKGNELYAYSPYVNEMEIWQKNVDEIVFCCPFWKTERDLLVKKIPFNVDGIVELKDFNSTSFFSIIKSIPLLIYNISVLFYAIFKADAIHLRCPGNVGLLGCIVQMFFPFKKKTAKYAGNWDPKSNQPWSYKLQKWILSNTFLTKNMQVLVYGEWKHQSKNIKSFFTATYLESDKKTVVARDFKSDITFLFVGSLSIGKQPLYAIQLLQFLKKSNKQCKLHIYGDGILKQELIDYIEQNNLDDDIILFGNQNQEVIKKAYQNSHFLILPSLSEGWPKVIAESMFWGCLPISTPVSCVANMLDNGNRGLLLTMDPKIDSNEISNIINNEKHYNDMSNKAIQWSRKFTLDVFENEIALLLK